MGGSTIWQAFALPLLGFVLVWACAVCVRLVLAHRRAWPPELQAPPIAEPELPAYLRLAALDDLYASDRIDAIEHAARRRELLRESDAARSWRPPV
ncbi:MAG: hypothetical protein ABW163_01395 [Luteimonas sp.]